MLPGASVSRVAQAEGVNAHQVFDWRRAYREGRLSEPSENGLIPVVFAEADRGIVKSGPHPGPEVTLCGAVHIELPDVACISIERGAETALVRAILEALRK